jgi:hypothetical protein
MGNGLHQSLSESEGKLRRGGKQPGSRLNSEGVREQGI